VASFMYRLTGNGDVLSAQNMLLNNINPGECYAVRTE
jgi:hypothetical protein